MTQTVKNIQPALVTLISTEVGYTKLRFTHTTPKDLDMHKRVAWSVVQGQAPNTATRTEAAYEGQDYFYISGLTPDTIYDVDLTHADEFVTSNESLLQEQYQNPTVLQPIQLVGIQMKKPVEISNITSNAGGLEIGSPPSSVSIELTGSASNVTIEAAPTGTAQWAVVYSGASASVVNVTMAAGSYDFRVTSSFVFADNTIDPGGTVVYTGGVVNVGSSVVPPNSATNLTFSAYKEMDTSSSFNLLLEWDFDETGGGAKRHFNIYYVELTTGNEDATTVDYTLGKVVVAVGTDYAFLNFPYRKQYAFKVEVAGWNNNTSPALYGKAYITEDSNEVAPNKILPTVGLYSPNTLVQIDNRYIRGYKEYVDAANNINTFEFDAATGNVTIGAAGVYGPDNTVVTTPFLFDADNARLAIAGQTITDEIISASYVMGWISGSSPVFRTKNKASYGDGTTGIWMGYEGATATDFKVDIGSATKYMRWTGDKLVISGDVVITDPNNDALEIGTITEIASAGSTPKEIYREDPYYYNTGAIAVPLTGNSYATGHQFTDVARSINEPVSISVKLRGAGANSIHVGINGTDLGAITNGTESDRWYHFQASANSGTNVVSVWDAANDSVVLLDLVVTYGTPSNSSATPIGWETTRPANIVVPTVISVANVNGSTVVGDWSVPTTLNAIDGVDGNRGNFIDYVYYVGDENQPTKPADYDANPAGWNPDIPIYNAEVDVVWISQATRDGAGLIIIPWSTPTRWNAVPGSAGAPGAGFYSQYFPYQDSNTVIVNWNEVNADQVKSHAMATDYFYKFFNRLPAEHEVITQYDGNDPSDSMTMMYQSGVWTTATATVHGDMIVDGSVRAQTLIADNLSAIRAQLGDVSAGSIRLRDVTTSNLTLDMVFNDVNVSTVFDFTDKNGDQTFQLSADDWTNNYYRGRIGKDSIDSTQAITEDTRRALNPYYLGDADTARIGPVQDVTSGQIIKTPDNTNVALRTVTTTQKEIKVQIDCRIEGYKGGPPQGTPTQYRTPKWSVQIQKRVNTGNWVNVGSAVTYTGTAINWDEKEVVLYDGSASIKSTHSLVDTIYQNEIVEYAAIITRVDTHPVTSYIITEVDATLDAVVNSFVVNEIDDSEDGYFVDKDTGFCVQWGQSNPANGANQKNQNQPFPRQFSRVFSVVAASTENHLDAQSCHATSWTVNGFTWVNTSSKSNNTVNWIAIGMID